MQKTLKLTTVELGYIKGGLHVFTCSFTLKLNMGHISYGNYVLSGPNDAKNPERCKISSSVEIFELLLETIGVDTWEKIPGTVVRVGLSGNDFFDTRVVSIGHWHQAYKEVTSGMFATADDFIYRWNGILSSGSLKSMLRLYYNSEGGSGIGGSGGSSTYLNDGTDKVIEKFMKELRITDDLLAQQIFSTLVTEEIWAQQKEKKRKLNPLEKYQIIQDYAKKRVISDNWLFSDETIPEYQARFAESLGFVYDPELKGFYRDGPDGVEKYDQTTFYNPARPSTNTDEVVTQLPSGNKAPTMPVIKSSGVLGPKRMPDGREIGLRRQKKTNPVTSDPVISKSTEDFIEEIKTDVLAVADDIDLPPSVILAQAILESNHGKSRIGNNIFGVKTGGKWTGATRTAKTAAGNATFRDYSSVGDSIRDYGRVLSSSRYSSARGLNDYAAVAQAIQDSGYAGNEKDYASKLVKIIEKYKLYEYDGV
jgi:flagellum-specific peptidoglycan hydrolase FlgJ